MTAMTIIQMSELSLSKRLQPISVSFQQSAAAAAVVVVTATTAVAGEEQ